MYAILLTVLFSGLAGLSIAPSAAASPCPNSDPPIVTGLASNTHPSEETFYGKPTMRFNWSAVGYCGRWIDGYSWDVVNEGVTSPALDCVIEQRYNHMGYNVYWTQDGVQPGYYEDLPTNWWKMDFRVRAIDIGGYCGPVSTFTVYNDYDWPAVTELRPSHGAVVDDPLTPIQVIHNDFDSGRDPGLATTIDTTRTGLIVDADWQSNDWVTLDYAATTDFKFTPTTNWEPGFHKFSFQLKDTAIGSPAPIYPDWGQFKMDCGGDLQCEAAYVLESVQNQQEDAQDTTPSPSEVEEGACERDDVTPSDLADGEMPAIVRDWLRRATAQYYVLFQAYDGARETLEPVTDPLDEPIGLQDRTAAICYQSVILPGAVAYVEGVLENL